MATKVYVLTCNGKPHSVYANKMDALESKSISDDNCYSPSHEVVEVKYYA